ncbi:MAG: FAD:protein FMN transferase [Clostridiales bacterium]|jgi:thiamine biosynthesis lipoprotein|nr:FAD:protein FMN transferase [Clostridiales bacterium]
MTGLKKARLLLAAIAFLALAASCKAGYQKFQGEFDALFDTHAEIIGYSKSHAQFDRHAQVIYDKMKKSSELFDIYYDYDGVANLETVNESAGIAPVKVDPEVIDLLKKCKELYELTGKTVNVAMGPVLSIWHRYRENGLLDPASAELPDMDKLKAASLLANMDDVIIDEVNQTVFLAKEGMSLDVGAIAKGYAAGNAMKAAVEAGMDSVLFNMGGNIISVGKPMDGVRDRWGVGIQDPSLEVSGISNILDTVFVNNIAIVSSGGYQRFYVVNGKKYNHIIDPETLMPAVKHAAVTVVHEDSCLADALSTALFILDEDEGRALASKAGAEAVWVAHDGTVTYTDGYKAISKGYGGYSGADPK